MNTSELAGTYYDPGYGTVTLFQEPHPDKADETILVANRTDIIWTQQWRLHHVSGDYWTLNGKLLFCNINLVLEFYAAEFKIGVDGKVAGLEVNFNDRDRQVNEGRVLFEKIEWTGIEMEGGGWRVQRL